MTRLKVHFPMLNFGLVIVGTVTDRSVWDADESQTFLQNVLKDLLHDVLTFPDESQSQTTAKTDKNKEVAETEWSDDSCLGGRWRHWMFIWGDETMRLCNAGITTTSPRDDGLGMQSVVWIHTIVRTMLINLTAISTGFWVKERRG